MTAGPHNSLLDVPGLSVGHCTRTDAAHLTGSTVVLAPPDGAVAGVDVRGGGPGTRETDLLDPRNLVERVHAVTLCGGSAYGLAAADGVMRGLRDLGRGYAVGPGLRVPIVPAAVIFDLGRGGDPAAVPDHTFGAAALRAAIEGAPDPLLGALGAGTGAQVAGGLKGGLGTASEVLPGGATVAVLVVLNAVGSTVDPATGLLHGAAHLLPGDLDGIPGLAPGGRLVPPPPQQVAAARDRAARVDPAGPPRTLATTIGVVATDLTLTKAQCARVAMSGHDGLARAVLPAHTMHDGDTLFALATGDRPAPDPWGLHHLLGAADRAVTRALVRATLAAGTVRTPAGEWRGYRDAFPGALEWAG